jgi:predicted PurR-regulated permease PerM
MHPETAARAYRFAMARTDAEPELIARRLEAAGGQPVAPPPRALFAGEEAVPRGLAATAAITLRVVIVLGGLWLLGMVALKLLVLVIPLVVAVLLSTVLAPTACSLERRGWSPISAAAGTVGGGVLAAIAIFSVIVPTFVAEIGDLAATVETGVRQLGESVAGGPLGLTEAQIDRSIDQAVEDFQGSGGSVARGVISGALLATQWATATVLAIFLTFYFVKDGPQIWRWIVTLFGPQRRPAINEMGIRSWNVLSAYFRGVALVATVDALLIGAGLLMLGVPLAVPLIVLTFFAAFFPIVGAIVAGAAAVLVALAAEGAVAAGIMLGVIIVVQQVEGNILYPVVVGRQLRLHPVAMLAALTAGGVLGGVAGAFLAVPVAAVIAAILEYQRSAERITRA